MDFQQAVTFVETHGAKMVMDPQNGINGIAVGQKDGGPIGTGKSSCVTAFVSRKMTSDELSVAHVRSFDQTISMATDQPAYSTEDLDVIETGSAFEAQSTPPAATPLRGVYGGNPPALNAQKPFQSLRAGIGITNPTASYPLGRLGVGTAGFYMRSDDGRLFLVSNNHVIGGTNTASVGDIVVQPGTLDLTAIELNMMPTLASLSAIQVGSLTAYVPMAFPTPTHTPANSVDAALAEIDPSLRAAEDVDRLTFGGGILGVANPYEVDANGNLVGSPRVYKVGRTTGYTEGVVTNVAAISNVSNPPHGNALFTGQIAVSATADNVGSFSAPGDSGSGVLNDRHELVGLLFAGSGARTLLNPIAEVIVELRAVAGIPSLQVVTV